MMPRFLSTWLPARSSIGGGMTTQIESARRHGARIRTDDDRELGEVVRIVLDQHGELAAVAVAAPRARTDISLLCIPLTSLEAGASGDTFIANAGGTALGAH